MPERQTTPTSQLVTSDLDKDELAFGELLLTGVSKRKAAKQVWPKISGSGTKAARVFAKPTFQRWYLARKEITYQTIREIAAKHNADYESRIEALAEAFSDPKTKWREKLQIHDKLTTAEGRKVALAKESSTGNALAEIAKAAGLGAALGASLPDGRFPTVRAVFPENQGQTGRVPALPPLAAPNPDVGRPEVADSERVP